jgi:hypothetical protein
MSSVGLLAYSFQSLSGSGSAPTEQPDVKSIVKVAGGNIHIVKSVYTSFNYCQASLRRLTFVKTMLSWFQ